MKSRFNIRWFVIGCIWLLACALTYWNSVRVDTVAAARESNEIAREEIAFQHLHIRKLTQVLGADKAMELDVPSARLGLIGLQGRLQAMATSLGLQIMAMQSEASQTENSQIPCQLEIHGPFEKAVRFLSALQEFPYLPLRQTHIKLTGDGDEVAMQIGLAFHYRISTPSEPDATGLQAIRQPQGEGADRL